MGHEFEDLFQQMADRAMGNPQYKLLNKSELKIFWKKRLELISEWSDIFTIANLWNIQRNSTYHNLYKLLEKKLVEKKAAGKGYRCHWLYRRKNY